MSNGVSQQDVSDKQAYVCFHTAQLCAVADEQALLSIAPMKDSGSFCTWGLTPTRASLYGMTCGDTEKANRPLAGAMPAPSPP